MERLDFDVEKFKKYRIVPNKLLISSFQELNTWKKLNK